MKRRREREKKEETMGQRDRGATTGVAPVDVIAMSRWPPLCACCSPNQNDNPNQEVWMTSPLLMIPLLGL